MKNNESTALADGTDQSDESIITQYFIGNAQTMSSIEIAGLTNKRHDHVIRDIRNMLEEIDPPNLGDQVYQDVKDERDYTSEYKLNEELTMTLITGYSVILRNKVIKRWQEQEIKQPSIQNISRIDIIKLALDSEEKRLQLEAHIAEDAPKVEFHDMVRGANNCITVSEAAKSIKTGQNRLFRFLRENKWITRKNEPYQAKIEAGYLDVKLNTYEHPKNGLQQSITTLITGKGLIKLKKLWSEKSEALPLVTMLK